MGTKSPEKAGAIDPTKNRNPTKNRAAITFFMTHSPNEFELQPSI
jgi:hypothetical protein